MQPLIEHRLELGGYDTRVLELEGHGAPLLLLHGYADSADTWRRMLALLGAEGRRAIAVDLPGFGAADRLKRDEPILPQLDRFAAAAIHHLAEDSGAQVVVSGNSLGGCVSLRAAADPALPIARVAPIAPAGFDHPVWFRAIESAPVIRYLLGPVPLPEFVVRRAVGEVFRQLAFAQPRAMDQAVINAFTGHHRTQRDVRRYLATGRRLIPELNNPFDLAAITAPVLLIWGERDRMVTHRGARHVIEALPDTQLELLEGIGHCPQVEAARQVTDLITEFSEGAAERAA